MAVINRNPNKIHQIRIAFSWWSNAMRPIAMFLQLKNPLYGYTRLIHVKSHRFSLKLTHFIRKPVNMDNEHFSVSRGTNYHITSTLLYEHILFCSLSMSEYLTSTNLTETASHLLKVLCNIQPTLLSCKLKESVQSKVMDSMPD